MTDSETQEDTEQEDQMKRENETMRGTGQTGESPAQDEQETQNEPLPEFVDWLLGALVGIGGMMFIIGGSTLTVISDGDLLAEAIEEGDVTVTVWTAELTDVEAIEVAETVIFWIGIGILLTGLGMVLFSVGYVFLRHRAHRRYQRGETISSFGARAMLGAVITVFTSFLPFSPAIGGAVAGYLERSESTRTVTVGAIAGLLPVIPVVTLSLFLLVGLFSGLAAIDRTVSAVPAAAVIFFTMMVVATVGPVLGALGGYVGGRLAEDRESA